MISYEAIVAELAKHIAQVQSVKSEAQMREEFAAIRALCDVALHNEESQLAKNDSIPKMMQDTVKLLPQQTSMQVPQSLTANKLEEDDANGDSIFDF
ncbi:YwdI family protein [Rummeliibacillus pycnus]|uniref:YwdI family protein n=1 Tax=Rummeliibacillus pycnus TaxID=101070 RepID=UPI003D2D5080